MTNLAKVKTVTTNSLRYAVKYAFENQANIYRTKDGRRLFKVGRPYINRCNQDRISFVDGVDLNRHDHFRIAAARRV